MRMIKKILICRIVLVSHICFVHIVFVGCVRLLLWMSIDVGCVMLLHHFFRNIRSLWCRKRKRTYAAPPMTKSSFHARIVSRKGLFNPILKVKNVWRINCKINPIPKILNSTISTLSFFVRGVVILDEFVVWGTKDLVGLLYFFIEWLVYCKGVKWEWLLSDLSLFFLQTTQRVSFSSIFHISRHGF